LLSDYFIEQDDKLDELQDYIKADCGDDIMENLKSFGLSVRTGSGEGKSRCATG